MPLRIAFFVSGNGSLFELCVHFLRTYFRGKADIVLLVSDRHCKALEKAKKLGVERAIFDIGWQKNRNATCDAILELCKKRNIDMIFTTFDKLLSGEILRSYQNKIINLHLSLLPAFKGFQAIERAVNAGCTFIGATTHMVTDAADGGPILLQGIISTISGEPLEKLKQRHYEMLKQLILQTLVGFIENKIHVKKKAAIFTGAQSGTVVNPCFDDKKIWKFLATYEK